MNRIVLFTSKSGFTKKYAEWIAADLKCDVRELKGFSLNQLKEYDQVIYGGWIMANTVAGYAKIKNLGLENLIVFGCGMSLPSDEIRESIAKQNEIDKDKFFYFEGGFNPKKVGLMGRLVIKMISKSIQKKEEKTDADLHMLETAKGVDRTNQYSIEELVRFANR